jgi:hypothetical protein
LIIFLILVNVFLGWECPTAAWAHSTGRMGYRFWQVQLHPDNRILTENPVAGKAGQNKSTKSEFGEFTSMEKCTQVLLIECIWQRHKFNKPFYHHFLKFNFSILLELGCFRKYSFLLY